MIRVEWRSTGLVSLKNCIELGSAKWFGGSEEYFQHFPLDLEQVDEIKNCLVHDCMKDLYLDLKTESQGGDALRDGGHAEGSLQVLRRGRGAVVGHLARSGRSRPRGSPTLLQVAFQFINTNPQI